MKIKPLAIALITASAALLSACDNEKTFNNWRTLESKLTLQEPTTIVQNSPISLTGNYDIIAFKKEENGNCISYTTDNSTDIPGCDTQSPVPPKAVRGKVAISYDAIDKSIGIAYKYDILDNGSYYPVSYVYDGNEQEANTFPAFKEGEQITKENGNSLFIDNITATVENNVLPMVKLVTDNGSTTYTFALKKENDLSILYDTHTPIDHIEPTQNFTMEDPETKKIYPYTLEPINLDPDDSENDINKDKNGITNPFGLFGYYKITGMRIYKADEYIADVDKAEPVYDTDARNGTKFMGEFWIIQPKNFLQLPNINLSTYIKYQIELDSFGQSSPDGIEREILSPKIQDISLGIQSQPGDEFYDFVVRTFNLVAQWDKTWPDRARKIVYRPLPETSTGEDNTGNMLYLDDAKQYVAVLTLEQMYAKQYRDIDGFNPSDMLNYNEKPYWQ